MENKILRYSLALIMGLALVSLTMHGSEQSAAPTYDFKEILNNIWEKAQAAAGKTLEETVEGLKPIGERAVNKLTEKVTQAASEKLELASTKVFDALDNLLGKETFNISGDMIKSATGAFTDLKSIVGTIDPSVVGTTLVDLSQIGTSAKAIAASPITLSNTIIRLGESAKALEKIVQVQGAIDSVAKLMKDAVEQSLKFFDKAYETASQSGVLGASDVAQQANDAILDIREKIQNALSPIINK